MSENMSLYEKVRSVPNEALKAIGGGRLKGMSDINPMWRIKMLTEMFGICGIGWKIEIVDKRLENGSANEIVCFVDINIYIKQDGEWSAPIPGMGGSSFVTQEKSGPYTSDECFKMAYTDAISVACKSLGFAADVYFASDRTKYTNQEEDQERNQAPRTTQQVGQERLAQEQAKANQRQQNAPAAIGGSVGAVTARVYKLREELGWAWGDLNLFASDVIHREVKFLKNDVKSAEEWAEIEKAMIVTRDASKAS